MDALSDKGMSRFSVDDGVVSWLERKDERGDLDATTVLAFVYCEGIGVGRSHERAFHLFRKAAERGHPVAQYDLDNHYLFRTEVKDRQSYELAFSFFKGAAEQGHARSCWKMAYVYYNGSGISSSEAKEKEWLAKALDNGFYVGV